MGGDRKGKGKGGDRKGKGKKGDKGKGKARRGRSRSPRGGNDSKRKGKGQGKDKNKRFKLKDLAGEVNADVPDDAEICKFCGSPEECEWGQDAEFCSDACYRAAGYGVAAFDWDTEEVSNWLHECGVGKVARMLRGTTGVDLCTSVTEGVFRRHGVTKSKAKELMSDVDWFRQGIWHQPEPPVNVVPRQIICETAHAKGLSLGWTLLVDDPKRRSYCAYKKRAIPETEAWRWFEDLHEKIPWKDLIDVKYQKEGQVAPRRTCFIVEKGCTCVYRYAGVTVPPFEEPDYLKKIRQKCCKLSGVPEDNQPNSCNANLYRDGMDSVGWHTDNEEVFEGEYNSISILSLSLGAGRRFQVKRSSSSLNPNPDPESIVLGHGDLASMEGMFQKYYLHSIPKAPRETTPRINITWRWITKHNKEEDNCKLNGPGNVGES